VHDLLPVYNCFVEGQGARRLTPADVEALGGDRDLSAQAFTWQASMEQVRLNEHRAVVGVGQATAQSLRFADGVLTVEGKVYGGQSAGKNRRGDGTVYRDSASLPAAHVTSLPQQHAPLAKTDAVLAHVSAVLTEQDKDQGPPLGVGELGLDVPDMVLPDESFIAQVTGIEYATDAELALVDAATGIGYEAGPVIDVGGRFEAELRPPKPGLYRVRAKGGGGGSPTVEQMVLAIDPELDAP
jgi:hypothetical protein